MPPLLRVASLSGVLVLATVLTGCSGDSDEPSGLHGPTAAAMPVSGHTLLVSGPFSGEGAERIVGTPPFTGGCLGAKNDKETFVVVWPDGTRITSPENETIVVDGKPIPQGSSFVAMGSFVHAPLPEQLPEVPIPCLGSNGQPAGVAWIHKIVSVSE